MWTWYALRDLMGNSSINENKLYFQKQYLGWKVFFMWLLRMGSLQCCFTIKSCFLFQKRPRGSQLQSAALACSPSRTQQRPDSLLQTTAVIEQIKLGKCVEILVLVLRNETKIQYLSSGIVASMTQWIQNSVHTPPVQNQQKTWDKYV